MDVPLSCDVIVLGQTCKIMYDTCEINVKTLTSKPFQILWTVQVKQVNRNSLVARTLSTVLSLSPTPSSRIFMLGVDGLA